MFLNRLATGVACWLAISFSHAQESAWTLAFDVMWESRWQQSGLLEATVRWPTSNGKTLKYSINKGARADDADRAREALSKITPVIGFKAQEIDTETEEAHIQFEIRRFTDMELQQSSCYAQPNWNNSLLTSVRVVLSEQYAYKCVLHELMHAMGFPGHPSGDSVLSYFEGNRLSLKPLDIFMLRTLYSGAIDPGASAIVTTRLLNKVWINEYVAEQDKVNARAAEQRWFEKTIQSMEAFANGTGEAPTILYRSGRLNSEGMRIGRMYVQAALAEAYLNGTFVEPDTSKGTQLLLMSAKSKNRFAANEIAFKLFKGDWTASLAEPLCTWLKTTSNAESGLSEARRQSALSSETCSQFN